MLEILVVDDNREEREQIVKKFAGKEVKIREASSGVEAIEILGKNPVFDLAVVDIIMPGLHGLDTMKRLKKLKPDLVVFLVAGEREYKLGERGVKLGAKGVIKKPITDDDVNVILTTVQELKVANVREYINFNFDVLIDYVQKVVDYPPSDKLIKLLEDEAIKELGIDKIILFEKNREGEFKQRYPENGSGFEIIDIPESEILSSEEIMNFIVGVEEGEFNSLLPLKNRDKIIGLVLIISNKKYDKHYALLIEKFLALNLKILWMQESLTDTIDLQAKAESEVEELKDKLSRAVALLDKMKQKLGKK